MFSFTSSSKASCEIARAVVFGGAIDVLSDSRCFSFVLLPLLYFQTWELKARVQRRPHLAPTVKKQLRKSKLIFRVLSRITFKKTNFILFF